MEKAKKKMLKKSNLEGFSNIEVGKNEQEEKLTDILNEYSIRKKKEKMWF